MFDKISFTIKIDYNAQNYFNRRICMKRAAFLDVDDTLLLTIFTEDGERKRILNTHLLQQLKSLNIKDILQFL